MNERGREVFVAAALKGVRQLRGALKDEVGGRCAVGLLLEDLGEMFSATEVAHSGAYDRIRVTYDVRAEDLIRANDDSGWDFLQIARKFGEQAS